MTPSPFTISEPRQARSALMNRALVTSFLANVPYYVYFKDRESRFLAVSHSLARYFGCAGPEGVIGKSDRDFFDEAHARTTAEDERRIIQTGESLVGKIEQESWPDGRSSWVVTNKLPLRNEQGHVVGTFGISKDITEARRREENLTETQRALVDASRIAGMAEVATGVLHNVGNVLNSLSVSTTVIATALRQSKAESLGRLSALLNQHRGDLAAFLTADPKGSRVPELLSALARNAVDERQRLTTELGSLQQNVDHIKEIVAMQQAYATTMGALEALDPAAMMEDAFRMNAAALVRHEVRVVRDFQFGPPIVGERGKVLQILVNLIRNAKYAADDGGAADKVVTLRVGPGEPGRVRLTVEDNGIGIPAENLTKIFRHGFTTRVAGHGFGLHSSANAAAEMKGTLTAHSAGPGCGASFILDLPAAPPAIPEEP